MVTARPKDREHDAGEGDEDEADPEQRDLRSTHPQLLHRAGLVSTTAAIVFAAGWATILPQFFGGQPVRLAHGLLMVVGGLWLAADLRRSPTRAVPVATAESEAMS